MSTTPKTLVKIEAEKEAWFKIGIEIQNDTDEYVIVSVTISNDIIRIK